MKTEDRNAKCIVYGCDNYALHTGLGVCSPCLEYLTKRPDGVRQFSQAWKNAIETAELIRTEKRRQVMGALETIQSLVDLSNLPDWYRLIQKIEEMML
jgi:hypothetical protein